MKIKRIHIENFRSIKKLDFEPGEYCVLIGENNSGKSTILRAVNLALGETWPSERSFSEEDFHDHDTSQDIVIQVFFSETIAEWRNNFKLDIAGVELRCKAYKKRVKGRPAGSLAVDYFCVAADGQHLMCPAEPLEKGRQFRGRWLPHRVSGEVRGNVPFIYVGAQRDYDRHTPTSRWSVLRRLLNEVNTEFLNDKEVIKVQKSDGTIEKMTRRQAFESAVKDAYGYLLTERFVEIQERLAANAMEQMGLDPASDKVAMRFESHDPTNAFRSLQLYVEQMGITSPAGEVGAGLQSAIVVAIFRTYEELKKEGAVFALEEPEVFLHPHRARYFAGVLRSLTEKGNQVFLTTHSPIFVALDQPESVAIVRRTEADGTMVHQSSRMKLADNDRRALRLLTEFDTQRNELFFARCVLLVEGATEKVAVPLLFRALGHDVNRLGISIVEVGGKTKLPLFTSVCAALKIPFFVLADHDLKEVGAVVGEAQQKERREKNRKHERWNIDIERGCPAETLCWMKPDFETECGLPRGEADKVDCALERFVAAQENDVPAVLRPMITKVLELAR